MSNKFFPILVLLGSMFFLFEDKIPNIDLGNLKNDDQVVVEINREISEEMKTKVSGIVDVVKKSTASQSDKSYASALWLANGDVWAQAKVNMNSDKLPEYNKELLSVFSLQYPQLVNSFPGFSQEVDKLFSEVIGEYPTPMTPEKVKLVSELSYAIGWAFTQ